MTQPATADLKDGPSSYESTRNVGDVLVGEDVARLLIEASSSGNDAALQNLLSQAQWIKTMHEKPHCIYYERCLSEGANNARTVMATQTSNLERCLIVAAQNGQAAVVSTLLAFAKHQSIDALNEATARTIVYKIIGGAHADVFRALASADPNIVNFRLLHGMLPLYEAARQKRTDVVAVLLELGADPLHPVQQSKKIGGYNSSLMSVAAKAEGPRMVEVLLKHGCPVAHTGALHTAARCGQLETMRLLMQHGADMNEALDYYHNWTPMHFAALKGQADAMNLLEQHGADSGLKDVKGRTPAQLLEESNIA
ncbi:ankyrin [Clathrospora elynae]|uniref:Ankyrin n=1 Tax=Clathrospora elynae TaxID=706981 RepID=A0A6A5SWL2_9PLEO|nr:ankyrin [Clathrospora elynae]